MLRDRAAIAGIGYTEFSKDCGVSTLTLGLRAVTAALEDAGLPIAEIDGLGGRLRQTRSRIIAGWRALEDGCFRWSHDQPLTPLSIGEAATLHREFLADVWSEQIEAELARGSL